MSIAGGANIRKTGSAQVEAIYHDLLSRAQQLPRPEQEQLMELVTQYLAADLKLDPAKEVVEKECPVQVILFAFHIFII